MDKFFLIVWINVFTLVILTLLQDIDTIFNEFEDRFHSIIIQADSPTTTRFYNCEYQFIDNRDEHLILAIRQPGIYDIDISKCDNILFEEFILPSKQCQVIVVRQFIKSLRI